MSRGLFEYPQKAEFGRVLPKNKVYTFGKVTRRVQGLFASDVEQIVWRYKLAPETVNLPAGTGVPEIQVFSIELKPGVNKPAVEIFQAIDGAIAFPIIFEVLAHRDEGDRLKVVAAYKRPSHADATKWVVGDHVSTDWVEPHSQRSPLPVALNLGSLYEQMFRQVVPFESRPGETLEGLAERYRLTAVKQRELTKLEAQLAREKQFNRRVFLNSQVRSLRDELTTLTASNLLDER